MPDLASAVPKRSATGHHVLLPASESHGNLFDIALVPTRSFLGFTFGRGTVIWRIWPAVLVHTVFAAAVVTMSLKTQFRLDIPNVLLTLLGVVIGFVISYRAMSGYDRYWQGRGSWSDVIRTSRTFARLVWFHAPLSLTPPKPIDVRDKKADDSKDKEREEKEREREVHRVMAEKRMALDMIEAFSIALKHHLRGEMGIYYEDLYPLVKPLHEHEHDHNKSAANGHERVESPEHPVAGPSKNTDIGSPRGLLQLVDPIIPPINSYGTTPSTPTHRSILRRASSDSVASSVDSGSSVADETRPLLPNSVLQKQKRKGILESISGDLIPFSGFFRSVAGFFRRKRTLANQNLFGDLEASNMSRGHYKNRPRIAGGGENIPLEILRALTCWLSVLEERGSLYGTTLGGMFGCISAFEDSLAGLEKILTTPLPFVFATHIRTVWIYLFALPFQLVDIFGWHTIPGVCVASFIYLGFIAAGEEMEQPFGYDINDLDIDLFCHNIIHADMQHLKRTPWKNVWLGHPNPIPAEDPIRNGKHGRIEELFGHQK